MERLASATACAANRLPDRAGWHRILNLSPLYNGTHIFGVDAEIDSVLGFRLCL
jgi:hypothetical protein